MCAQSLSHVRLFVTPWTVAHQASLSTGFSEQKYWNGLLFPPPGELPDPGIEPRSPALADGFSTTEQPGKSSSLGPRQQFSAQLHLFCMFLLQQIYFPLFISGSVKKKKKQKLQSWNDGEFPGGPIIRILNFHYQESGFNPWLRNQKFKKRE